MSVRSTVIDPRILFGTLLVAVAQGMLKVRNAQLTPLGLIVVKADQSLLLCDAEIEEELKRIFLGAYPDLDFHGEEHGRSGSGESRYLVVLDPIDGTRPFANRDMGGSTIIMYIYDKVAKKIVASVIGRPGTGELWGACGDVTTRYMLQPDGKLSEVERCRVWQYDPEVSGLTVYVDNSKPFTRLGVGDMLYDNNLDVMDAVLRRRDFTKLAIGSNGLHHCLVASGGPVAGSITNSIGGIQDLGGIAIVEGAGGVVAVFYLDADRKLVQVNPHADLLMRDGKGYDFLVTAIDDEHLRTLVMILEASLA